MAQIPTETVPPREDAASRRVQAQVALVLLETLKRQDRPGEVLDDEDVALTIPRRFGLSGVVEAQIRRYRDEARGRGRIPEGEIRDLLRLVTRRPDSEDVFVRIGRSLTAATDAPRWRRMLPRRIAFSMARRRVLRRMKALFGGPMLEVAEAPFALDAVHDLLLEADPGGEACELVTGLAEAILETAGIEDPVRHVECQARGDDRCRWTVSGEPARGTSPAREAEDETEETGGER